jgi:asparagine synthase (glutamine-hydrolysing)
LNKVEILTRALEEAMAELVPDERIAVLFSGGLDSTIVAKLAAARGEPTLYTVGVKGSYDLEVGERTARLLDLPWEGIVISEDELLESIPEMVRIMGTRNPIPLSFEMPLYFVSRHVTETRLYGGQGADELFAGYARYLEMSEEERAKCMECDLETLLTRTLRYEASISEHFGKRIYHPYLHRAVREVVTGLPMSDKMGDGVRKAILREVARGMGLGEAAERKKKAAQYGSGVMRAMKAVAKRRGMTVRRLIAELSSDIEIDE